MTRFVGCTVSMDGKEPRKGMACGEGKVHGVQLGVREVTKA